jgi:immune inhibitor A
LYVESGKLMKRARSIGIVGVMLGMLLLGACRLGWSFQPDHAVRPAATATPSQNSGGLDGSVRPVPISTPLPPSSTTQTATLTELSTDEQLALVVAPTRDLRDLAMRFNPELGGIPLVVNETTPDYNVGDRLEFWAHDTDTTHDFTVTAELIHKTDVAYAWVEVGQPVDKEGIAEAVDIFSEQSYPAEVAFFGSEWNPGVDNDPRLHILHTTGLGGGIAGYYSSADQYSQIAHPRSNEKEMFYINLSWLNGRDDYTEYETVLAHEFQHMIHWHNDRNETTWINEGLSEYARQVAGYEPETSFARDFAQMPDTQLNAWGVTINTNSTHYGSAYLFMDYLVQRTNPEVIRALVAQSNNSIYGIDAVLAETGNALTFNDLFADWVVANYVDDPYAMGQDGIYGYLNFDQAAPLLDATYADYPTEQRITTVANYGTDYILLEGEGDVVFNFEGSTITDLAELTPPSGRYLWWSNRGDDFNTRLTRRFDLRDVAADTPVEMRAELWWDIEQGYDTAYVSVSRDGETWEILPGTSTTISDENTTFGPGYTGSSDGWRTEHFNLTAFAGAEVYVRFEYVTDDAINTRGVFVDDIAIPAIGYASDFEQGPDGWESEGWLLTDNELAQEWIIQLLTLDQDRLVAIEEAVVDAQGQLALEIPGLGDGRTAVIAISGATPVTTEPAEYQYRLVRP